MADYLLRVWSKQAGVRALVCLTTDLVNEAARRHQASPVATGALGYGLTAAILLGALLKVQQRVALKVEGDGPLRKMVLEADAYGRVHGYIAEPDVPWPLPIGRWDVAEALVDCHFCHERYVFDQDALEAILDELEEAALLTMFDDEEPT